MDPLLWQRLHGGSTHAPIVLLPVSALIDVVAGRLRDPGARRGLRATALGSAISGILGGLGAAASGLFMTNGQVFGDGLERMHHLFVWPAFALGCALVAWRCWRRGHLSPISMRVYLAGMAAASALMLGAGCYGGEMLLGAETKNGNAGDPFAAAAETAAVARGHDLFLLNCAHCHGDDGLGSDEAPNLATRQVSNARIALVVHNGIKGEMPKFNQKLTDNDVQLLIHFVHSIKSIK
jgi:mono/diheme cytochrome c family protein